MNNQNATKNENEGNRMVQVKDSDNKTNMIQQNPSLRQGPVSKKANICVTARKQRNRRIACMGCNEKQVEPNCNKMGKCHIVHNKNEDKG